MYYNRCAISRLRLAATNTIKRKHKDRILHNQQISCLNIVDKKRSWFSSSSSSSPWVRPLGESALLVRFGNNISTETNARVLKYMGTLEKALPEIDGVKEILPAFASLLVHFDPLKVNASDVKEWCLGVRESDDTNQEEIPRTVTIPVKYGGEHGPDLALAADIAGVTVDEAVRLHSEATYRVYFLGFTGGFPYLGGLADDLASVPRLTTPRQTVPKGAVGIAAGQTGIYTLKSPGGWHLLGRTPENLFDPTKDPPSMLKPGDAIKFMPIPEEEDSGVEFNDGDILMEDATKNPDKPWVEIISPGPLTSVQDLGREGYARYGVSRSGAADDLALRTGNSLIGNPEDCAGLEIAMGNLKLRALGTSVVALTGANCNATLKRSMFQGAPPEQVRTNQAISLQKGDELELGIAKDGARSYLCVQGGIDVPTVLGSRSTDIKAKMGGFNGRILQPGDKLGRCTDDARGGKASLLHAAYDPLREERGKEWVLRMLPGPGNPGDDSAETTQSSDSLDSLVQGGNFKVTPRSDRMAVCVSNASDDGTTTPKLVGGQQMSEACVSGTVQLPPDGNPVILLAEHQTTGGYKVPGVVIQADLWKVGQMLPGDSMRFEECTVEEAAEALKDVRAQLHKTRETPADHDPSDYSGMDLSLDALYVFGQREEEYWNAILEYTEGNMGMKEAGAPKLAVRTGSQLKEIDLNADFGEGFDDHGILKYVTSANIACSGHAGTTETIAQTVALAAAHKIGIGAHVSFVDKEGFGRRTLDTPPAELRDQVLWQVGALEGLCKGADTRVSYIKPHGALYHAVMAGTEQGRAVYDAAQTLGLPLLLMPRSPWASFGEGFAERRYDGESLRPRDKDGAVIHDPSEAAEQAVLLAQNETIHTICVHGDSPNAVDVAKKVREGLESEGFSLKRFL